MSCEHLLVDALSNSANVLYDLDSSLEAFHATRLETQPPRRRRSWSSSMLADGSVETANAYENREIRLTMQSKLGATAQDQAEDMQLLQRLFAGGGMWLKHRSEGVTAPVFYRLLPAEIAFTNYFETSTPLRDITFTIPADPFGYGLPETGSATVTNDPTDSNGMRFSIANVKGDVPAPLRLAAPGATSRSRRIFASTTYQGVHRNSMGFSSGALGSWSASTQTDATAVGGSYVRADSTGAQGSAAFMNLFADVVPGDYRILVRSRSLTGAPIGLSAANSRSVVDGSWAQMPRTLVGTNWAWVDVGVHRVPSPTRLDATTPPSAQVWIIGSPETSAAAQLDVDDALLVPAPGGDGAQGALLTAGQPPEATAASAGRYVLDGALESMWTTMTAALPGISYGDLPWSLGGGFPMVYPGSTMRVWAIGANSGTTDVPISGSTDIDWSYYPLYLYQRGD